MQKEVFFRDNDLDMNLSLSTGKYDSFEGEEDLFYIGIFDDDDLCYQYDGLSQDVVDEVFEEIKDKVNDTKFYEKIFPETCELYGLVRGK